MEKRYFTAAVVVAALQFGLSGCSGSEDDETAGENNRNSRFATSNRLGHDSPSALQIRAYKPGVLNEDKLPQVTSETLRVLDFLRRRMSNELSRISPADPAQLAHSRNLAAELDLSHQLCARGGQARATLLAGPRFNYGDGQIFLGAGARQRTEMNYCGGALSESYLQVGSFTAEVISGLIGQSLEFVSESGQITLMYDRYGSLNSYRTGSYQQGDIRYTLHSPLKLAFSGQSYLEMPLDSRRLEFGLSDFTLALEKQPANYEQEDGQLNSPAPFRIGLGSLGEDYSIELSSPLMYNSSVESFWSGTILLRDGSSTLKLEIYDGYTEYHFDAASDGSFETVQVL